MAFFEVPANQFYQSIVWLAHYSSEICAPNHNVFQCMLANNIASAYVRVAFELYTFLTNKPPFQQSFTIFSKYFLFQ